MAETIPQFGAYRPLREDSAKVLGEFATLVVGRVTEHFHSRGYDYTISLRQEPMVTLVSEPALSQYLSKLPEGAFDYGAFKEQVQTKLLPTQARDLSVRVADLCLGDDRRHQGLVLGFDGTKGAGLVFANERQALRGALAASGAGKMTHSLGRTDRAPEIDFMTMKDRSGKMPAQARRTAYAIALRTLTQWGISSLYFDDFIIGTKREPLPEFR
ncbi:MAG TPA: hypothetical protein VLE73_02195 [Candidatus Saccharimonadales bacterium]|nr:hypothetical protein [Candidatus Saccharimonadales bacterium]